MSRQLIINSIFIMLFGTFFGYGVTHMAMNRDYSHSLDMASLAPTNSDHTLTKIASQQIYQDYFDVRIKHDEISKSAEGQSIVKAIITAKKDLPAGLTFKWKLGENVTSHSTELTGQLGAFKRGEKQEFALPVYGFTKQSKRFLSLVVSGKVDNHELHKESLSSSRPEDSFEYVVQQAYQLEQDRAKEEKQKSNGKIKTQSVRSKKFDLGNIIK